MRGFHPGHFWAMATFALCVSLAFAVLGRHSAGARFQYALWYLALFLVVAIGIAWLMYPFSR